MCFVWIWEQTAIISLYNINWLVFIMERESVYCAVRTGALNIVQVNLKLWLLSSKRSTRRDHFCTLYYLTLHCFVTKMASCLSCSRQVSFFTIRVLNGPIYTASPNSHRWFKPQLFIQSSRKPYSTEISIHCFTWQLAIICHRDLADQRSPLLQSAVSRSSARFRSIWCIYYDMIFRHD